MLTGHPEVLLEALAMVEGEMMDGEAGLRVQAMVRRKKAGERAVEEGVMPGYVFAPPDAIISILQSRRSSRV